MDVIGLYLIITIDHHQNPQQLFLHKFRVVFLSSTAAVSSLLSSTLTTYIMIVLWSSLLAIVIIELDRGCQSTEIFPHPAAHHHWMALVSCRGM